MTLCPIAIAVGCKKCPIFKVCPVKGLIGDMPKAPEVQAKTPPRTKTPAKPRAAAAKKKK